MNPDRPTGIALPQVTFTFVPAGALLIWALLYPELTRELDLNRTKLTIWATTFLLLPALLLYPFRAVSVAVANLAHLFWTFAYLVYLVHAWWAVFVIFKGVTDTFEKQGTLIAGVNFFLTGLWTVDVLLLWVVPAPGRGLVLFRAAVRVFTFLVFAVTLLFLRPEATWWLGIVFAAMALAAVVVRLLATTAEKPLAA